MAAFYFFLDISHVDVDINDFYCLTKKFGPLLLGISGGLVVNINKTHLCQTCNYPIVMILLRTKNFEFCQSFPPPA